MESKYGFQKEKWIEKVNSLAHDQTYSSANEFV